jgi:hypothetical protein
MNGIILRCENDITQDSACPSATLSTINSIWTCLEPNLGHCSENETGVVSDSNSNVYKQIHKQMKEKEYETNCQ